MVHARRNVPRRRAVLRVEMSMLPSCGTPVRSPHFEATMPKPCARQAGTSTARASVRARRHRSFLQLGEGLLLFEVLAVGLGRRGGLRIETGGAEGLVGGGEMFEPELGHAQEELDRCLLVGAGLHE